MGMAHRIVVGVDGSASSKAALRWATRQAKLTGATVDAVIAWHYPVAYSYPVPISPLSSARELAQRVLEQSVYEATQGAEEHADITPKVIEGNAERVLLDESQEADMLVVGSRGHGGFVEALLGSTSQHCVQHATCPVVVIRDAGPPTA
jgi:nucleotide-binding universal stress UspA family protein